LRYGIIADIHSNLEALRAVLDILKRQNIDRFLCLGDIVGYGANPNECIEEVRNLEAESIIGNHEWGVIHPEIRSFFNPVAKQAIEWTERELSNENQDYLAHLGVVKETNLFSMVHSTLYEPTQWYYIISPEEAELNFPLMKKEIVFFAHSHQAVIYSKHRDENCKGFALPEGGKILLKRGYRYLINPGSVGQPRDGNPQASFGIYDTESRTVQIKRCNYDINKAREKILKAGLPSFLAERLVYGI
jgi:predicted phosphodiesterase